MTLLNYQTNSSKLYLGNYLIDYIVVMRNGTITSTSIHAVYSKNGDPSSFMYQEFIRDDFKKARQIFNDLCTYGDITKESEDELDKYISKYLNDNGFV